MNPFRCPARTRALLAVTALSLALAAGCSTDESSSSTTTDRYGSSGTTATVLGATTDKQSRGTPEVRLRPTTLGQVLTDESGRTLYAYAPDGTGAPTCTGSCAVAWPPYYVSGSVRSGPGVSAQLSTVTGPGSRRQVTVDGQPVYRFSGDTANGQTNGQSSGGTWFVLDVSGTVVPG